MAGRDINHHICKYGGDINHHICKYGGDINQHIRQLVVKSCDHVKVCWLLFLPKIALIFKNFTPTLKYSHISPCKKEKKH